MFYIYFQDVMECWRYFKIIVKKEIMYYVESKINLRVKVLVFGWIFLGE